MSMSLRPFARIVRGSLREEGETISGELQFTRWLPLADAVECTALTFLKQNRGCGELEVCGTHSQRRGHFRFTRESSRCTAQ